MNHVLLALGRRPRPSALLGICQTVHSNIAQLPLLQHRLPLCTDNEYDAISSGCKCSCFESWDKLRDQMICSYHYATTPSLRRLWISASLMLRMLPNISSVCWPKTGGGVLILGSENEYLTGVFTIFIGPHVGCSISVTILRASTTESAIL